MYLTSKFNKGFRILLCVIDIYSKYAWVVPLKDKKGGSIVHVFQRIFDDSTELHSKRKPSKIWGDKGSEFYNSNFKKWNLLMLKTKHILTYKMNSKRRI